MSERSGFDENVGVRAKPYEKKRSETELMARREQHGAPALTEGPSIASWGSVHTPSFQGTLLTIFPWGSTSAIHSETPFPWT